MNEKSSLRESLALRTFWFSGAAALSLLLLQTEGCRQRNQEAEPVPVDTVMSQAAEALPDLRFGKPKEYVGRQLYDYMDGAAEPYLQHRFRRLVAVDVRQGETKAKVELFELASRERARQLFDYFSGGAPGSPLDAGEAAKLWPGREPEGIFHQDRLFARVLVYGKGETEACDLLKRIASALGSVVPKPGGK